VLSLTPHLEEAADLHRLHRYVRQGVSGGAGVPDPFGAAHARQASPQAISRSHRRSSDYSIPVAGSSSGIRRWSSAGRGGLLLDLASLFSVPAYGAQTINRAGPGAARGRGRHGHARRRPRQLRGTGRERQ
jgi:hypothetical protein